MLKEKIIIDKNKLNLINLFFLSQGGWSQLPSLIQFSFLLFTSDIIKNDKIINVKIREYVSNFSNHSKSKKNNDVNPRELVSEVTLRIKGITQQNRCIEEVNTKKYEDIYLNIKKIC